MHDHDTIAGIAAPLPLANLDTDQIMPKQFLRGIDKSGLAEGLLFDFRYDEAGQARQDFVLNQPAYDGTRILIGGANFGCGSSREHAVWGLQQYGIDAVIAPSYGEIFYSNSMNNRLMLVMLSEEQVQALLDESAASSAPLQIEIDVRALTVRTPRERMAFSLAPRYQQMFLQGLDMIGASLTHEQQIRAFADQWWQRHPWTRNVARLTRDRLDGQGSQENGAV